MEEPITTILVTLVIHEQKNTPTTKVQSSLCLLGSSFVFLLRSPLGITEVVASLLLTRSKLGDLWLIAAVDISLVMIQLVKQTKGGLRAGVCAVVHVIGNEGKGVVTIKNQCVAGPQEVHSKSEVYNILEKGSDKRKTAETFMNAQSSRLVRIIIKIVFKLSYSGHTRCSL